MKKTIIVEGKSIINHLVKFKKEEKQNKPNDIVLGFSQHIREILSTYDPENIAVIFPSTSNITSKESGSINKILMSMGVPVFNIDPDLIGYHVHSIRKKIEGNVAISSLSSSILQMIDESTEVIRFDTEETVTHKTLKGLVGLEPSQIKDFIAMSGDSDFGIETIIGHKMAIDWLVKYNNIEGIIENTNNMNRAMKSLFEMKIEEINRQRSLSDLSNIDELYDEINPSFIKRNQVDIGNLHSQYIENKLFDWLPSDLREKYSPKTNFNSEITYAFEIKGDADREDLIRKIDTRKGISFYVDGDFASLSQKKGESFVLDITNSENFNIVKDILSSLDQKIVSHDSKELMHWGRINNIEVNNIISDSAIISYTLNTVNSEKSLESLSSEFLGINIEKIKKPIREERIRNIAESSDLILRLNRKLYEMLVHDGRAKYLFEKIELPMIKTLYNMEKNGVYIDTDKLSKLGSEIEERMLEIEKEVNLFSKKEISLGNPSSVSYYIFDVLKMPIGDKKESERSTAEGALDKIKNKHHTIPMIIEHRKISKILSTYIKPYLSIIDPEESRIFAKFMQNVTSTSRLSSRNPNLQAIPIRSSEGKKIRSAFSAPKECLIAAIDYSQIELRILAHLSQDPVMMEAFKNGVDIHLETAAKVFKIDRSEVTGEQRRFAKAINFGIVYRMSAYGLSQKLGCTAIEASQFIDDYFEMFKGVKLFLDKTLKDVKENGYLNTVYGRKLFHPDVNNPDFRIRTSAERAAVNSPMQGSASDIIKIAMNEISRLIESKELKTKMLMQVHDELVFQIPKNEAEYIFPKIKEIMEKSAKLSVPLMADAEIGEDWATSHSLDHFKKNLDEQEDNELSI